MRSTTDNLCSVSHIVYREFYFVNQFKFDQNLDNLLLLFHSEFNYKSLSGVVGGSPT